ncbi:adenomatous polyposis coli protein-like [Glandiceps talaboti]
MKPPKKVRFKKMAVSSYDQLLHQVESLKAENSHLRQELQDNSSHLTKLECEASNMKDVLTQIHTGMHEEDTSPEGTVNAANVPDSVDQNSNGELPAEMPASGVTLRPKTPQSPFSSRSSDTTSSSHYSGSSSGRNTPHSKLSLEILARLQELDNERLLILRDTEAEEKEKEWYYTQMQSLTQKIDSLPITETVSQKYSLQNDMTRRQLEYEAKQLREAMQQRLGAIADMQARYEARIHRVRLLEKEMLRLQQHYEEIDREGRKEEDDDNRRDSGNCELFEGNANGGESHAATPPQHVDTAVNTSDLHSRQGPIVRGRDSGFLSDTDHTKDGHHHHHHKSFVTTTVNGTRMVTIATQTPDVYANSGNPYAHLSADNGSMPAVNVNVPQSIYHGAWPMDRSSTPVRMSREAVAEHQETASMVSFSSSSCSGARKLSSTQLGTKVEMVYSLLSMLGTHDKDDMSRTLLAMSSSQDSCIAMRQSGCLPLLIQLLHGPDKDSLLGDTRGSKEARARAAAALHNIVHSHPEEKRRRQEARVLRLLEQIRAYCDSLKDGDNEEENKSDDTGSRPSPIDHHPGPSVAALMKLSFDEEHRSAMCQLGGLQAIADLLQLDYDINRNNTDQYSNTLRRYAGMALTNLTFGDGANKALLCSLKGCMQALVAQLKSDSEDLRQVVASVLRNLSWRADLQSKKILREVGSVTALMESAVQVKKESTLKSILSALWNLSAHCTENKADICAVDGALAFLVETLQYKSPSRTMTVVENAGGILRNVSSHIATREDYRQTLRDHNCLHVLLGHLASPSLTTVSNACGTLWNLSARNTKDQEGLWEMGAVSMLRNLVNSKHKMIAMGSSAALRNLMAARPDFMKRDMQQKDGMPSLHVRKQRALEADIEKNLQENNPDTNKLHQRDSTGKRDVDIKELSRISSLPRRLSLRAKQRIFPPGSGPTHEMARPQDNSRHRSRSPRGHSPANRMPPQILDNRLLHQRSRSPSLDKDQEEDNRTRTERGKETDNNKKEVHSLERTREGHKGSASRITKVMQEVAMHAGISSASNIEAEKREGQEAQVKDNKTSTKNSASSPQKKSLCTRSNSLTFGNTDFSNLTSRSNSYSFGIDNQVNHMYVKRSSNESINSITSDPMGAHTRLPYHRPAIDHSFSVDSTLNALSSHPEKQYIYHNRMRKMREDIEGDMDTTIDFSRKYSDESIPGRQSPSTAEGYRREHVQKQAFRSTVTPSRENYLNVSGHYDRMLRSESPNKYRHTFGQNKMPIAGQEDFSMQFSDENIQGKPSTEFTVQCQDCNMPHRQRESMASGHIYPESNVYHQQYRPPVNEHYHKADFETDRTTNYSSQYSESSNSYDDPHDFASDDQPTDYTQKYATDLPNSFESEHMPPDDSAMQPAEPAESSEPSGQTEVRKKAHEDKPTNYCVEDTPVCFSRCSSLSSLHSNEADENGTQAEQPVSADHDQKVTSEIEGDATDKSSGTIEEENRSISIGEASGSGTYTPELTDQHDGEERKEAQNGEVFIEETPLVFSRSSSLSSLSSFELHSLHDDRSSVYSSHRASEVVSPSDLPDSPSEPMHQSPKRSVPDESAKVKGQDMATEPPKPASDGILQFCTEGTPMGFSGATSLSSLSFEGEEKILMDPELKVNQNDSTTATVGTELNSSRQDIADVDLSGETTEAEQSILEDCISSAMPPKKQTSPKNKVRSKLHKSPSTAHTTKHVSFSQQVFSHDAPQTFCTEDTPLNFSTATSLSDLSIDDIEIKQGDDGKMTIENPTELKQAVADDPKSESSSILNENDSTILAECINSAMPKPKPNKPKGFHLGKRKSQKPAEKSAVKRISPGSQAAPRLSQPPGSMMTKPTTSMPSVPSAAAAQPVLKTWTSSTPPDTMTSYCTEGTPLNFSTATSLSDLTIDSAQDEDIVNGNAGGVPKREILETKEKHTMKSTTTAPTVACAERSPFDSPHAFDVEGTPVCFSRNDSLSSLECDDDVDFAKEKLELKQEMKVVKKEEPLSVEATKKVIPRPVMRNPKKTPASVKRVNQNKKITQQVESESPSPQQQTVTTYNPRRVSDEIPHNFAVEGTPVCFSRNSSLSSLSDFEGTGDLNEPTPGTAEVTKENAERVKGKESPRYFAVEDTPVCFSRNSSLSSLSMESLNCEPTPSEQALLNDVINAAMPKSKPNPRSSAKGSRLPARQGGPRIMGGKQRTPPVISPVKESPVEVFDNDIIVSPTEGQSWRRVENESREDSNRGPNDDDEEKANIEEEVPVKRRPRIMKPGELSARQVKPEEVDDEPKGVKGGKKVYRSPYSQNRASSAPRMTTTTTPPPKTVTPLGRGTSPAKRGASSSSVGRGTSPAGRGIAVSPAGRGTSPAGRGMSASPAGRGTSPAGRGSTTTTTGRVTTPSGRGTSPAGRGTSPAGRGSTAGRGISPQTKTGVAGRGTGRGRARSAPATRTSTPTPGSRSSSPPGFRSAGTTPKSGTPPRTASPTPKGNISAARTTSAGARTTTATTASTSAASRTSVGKSAIPRTASPASKQVSQSPAGRPPPSSSATRSQDSPRTSSATRTATSAKTTAAANSRTTRTGIPSRTTSPATRTTTATTTRTASPAAKGTVGTRSASPATSNNRSANSSAAGSRSASPANRTNKTTGTKTTGNTSRQSSLSRASSKDSVSSSIASRSPRNSISSPSPKSMSPATQRRQNVRPNTPGGRGTPARSTTPARQNTASQNKAGGSRIAKPVSRQASKGNAPNAASNRAEEQVVPKPKLVKQSTFTKESPSKVALNAAAKNAGATAVSDISLHLEDLTLDSKANTQRVSPWRRPSPTDSQSSELSISPSKPNPWKKPREVESPETEVLSPVHSDSDKKDNSSDSGSNQSSPRKGNQWKRHVSKNEYDIPVINYGGHISSPSSETNGDNVWVKMEDCPINSPTGSRPSSIRTSRTGSSASSPSGSIHRIISPISPVANRSIGSSIQSLSSSEAASDRLCSRESINTQGGQHSQRRLPGLKERQNRSNRTHTGSPHSFKDTTSENEKCQSDISSPSPTRRHSPRGSPKKNKKKSKNDLGSGSCGVGQNNDFDVLVDDLAEGILGIEMEPEPDLVSNSDLDEDEEEEEEEEEEDFNLEDGGYDDDEFIMAEPEPINDDAVLQEHPPQETRQQRRLENRLNSFILINDNEELEGEIEAEEEIEELTSPSDMPSTGWRRSSSKEEDAESSPRLQKMPATRKPPLSNEKPAIQTVKPVMVSPFNYSGPLPSKSSSQSPGSQPSSQPPSRPLSPEGTPTRRTMIPRPVGFRGPRQTTNRKGEEIQDENTQNSNSRSYLVTSV